MSPGDSGEKPGPHVSPNQERGRLPYRSEQRGNGSPGSGLGLRYSPRLVASGFQLPPSDRIVPSAGMQHGSSASSSVARGGSTSSSALSARSGGAPTSPRTVVNVDNLLAELLEHGLLACMPQVPAWANEN